jgi:hypothetical protein
MWFSKSSKLAWHLRQDLSTKVPNRCSTTPIQNQNPHKQTNMFCFIFCVVLFQLGFFFLHLANSFMQTKRKQSTHWKKSQLKLHKSNKSSRTHKYVWLYYKKIIHIIFWFVFFTKSLGKKKVSKYFEKFLFPNIWR